MQSALRVGIGMLMIVNVGRVGMYWSLTRDILYLVACHHSWGWLNLETWS